MVYTFRNLLGLFESAIMLREINVEQLNFSSRAIGIINFEKNSKFYRRHYKLISKLNIGLKFLYARAFRY